MKYLYFLTILLTFHQLVSWAQPITTFPYVEDFDGFPASTSVSFVTEPNPDPFTGGWTNELSADGPQDWYVRSGQTPTTNTGPHADRSSINGKYLYVEDSGNNANNDRVSILSPIFDLTGLSTPRLSYWLHSNANCSAASYAGDSSLNHLLVEVWFDSTWTLIDSIDTAGADWTERILVLDSFPGQMMVRFTVNNNNHGDFIHDIAVDDVSIFDMPAVDAAIVAAYAELVSHGGYTMVPFSQLPQFRFGSTIQNRGLQALTGGSASIQFEDYADTLQFSTLQTYQDTTLIFPSVYQPSNDQYGFFNLSIDSIESLNANNNWPLELPDTIYARDNGIVDGSIGFSAPGARIGNVFELNQPDFATSSTLYLDNDAIGDSIRVLLYGFGNDAAGQPDNLPIDSSDFLEIIDQGWQSVSFRCPVKLEPGKYFLAVEQVTSANMSLGYTFEGHTPATTFFQTGNSPVWDTLESFIPALEVTMMLRLNFGPRFEVQISSPAADICVGDSIVLAASGLQGSYLWIGSYLTTDTGSQVSAIPSHGSSEETYRVIYVDQNGCTSSDSVRIIVNQPPDVSIATTNETNGSGNGTATVTVNNGIPPYQFLWNDTQNQTTSTAFDLSEGIYVVNITDSNGCMSIDTAFIESMVDSTADTIPDTTIVIGVSLPAAQAVDQPIVSPNPTSGKIRIGPLALKPDEALMVHIFDARGRLVYRERIQGAQHVAFDLGKRLIPGSYLLRLASDRILFQQKLIYFE